jgi:hypothetical protein
MNYELREDAVRALQEICLTMDYHNRKGSTYFYSALSTQHSALSFHPSSFSLHP